MILQVSLKESTPSGPKYLSQAVFKFEFTKNPDRFKSFQKLLPFERPARRSQLAIPAKGRNSRSHLARDRSQLAQLAGDRSQLRCAAPAAAPAPRARTALCAPSPSDPSRGQLLPTRPGQVRTGAEPLSADSPGSAMRGRARARTAPCSPPTSDPGEGDSLWPNQALSSLPLVSQSRTAKSAHLARAESRKRDRRPSRLPPGSPPPAPAVHLAGSQQSTSPLNVNIEQQCTSPARSDNTSSGPPCSSTPAARRPSLALPPPWTPAGSRARRRRPSARRFAARCARLQVLLMSIKEYAYILSWLKWMSGSKLTRKLYLKKFNS